MNKSLRILHLEDNNDDAELVKAALVSGGLAGDIHVAATRDQYLDALHDGGFDLILSDSGIPGFEGVAALAEAHKQKPGIPFIFVSGAPLRDAPASPSFAGGIRYVPKAELERLAPTVRQALHITAEKDRPDRPDNYLRRTGHLIRAMQELSRARDLPTVTGIVRQAARELTGSDGATVALRDGDSCHYVEENAVTPLWKGERLPLTESISGWVILNRQPAVIEDIDMDPRVTPDTYRSTFIKSLAVIPIGSTAPFGAVGNYWARPHQPSPEEVKLLQALADSAAIAMENVQFYRDMGQRVKDRAAQLAATDKELEAFCDSVSHDLVEPLRSINGFSRLLLERSGAGLDADDRDYLQRICHASVRMNQLIGDLLKLSRIVRTGMHKQTIDLTAMAREIVAELRANSPDREVDFSISNNVSAHGDPRLLYAVMENLLGNAWKFTSRQSQARISFGCTRDWGDNIYYVQDNGVGFDMAYARKLFVPFQTLHPVAEFPGAGIGLATVQRIIHKHGGRIWATGNVGTGATFNFTLPSS